jgi:hypothetical protein
MIRQRCGSMAPGYRFRPGTGHIAGGAPVTRDRPHGRLFLYTPGPFLGSAFISGGAIRFAEFHFVLPALRTAARRVESLTFVPNLLLDGIQKSFITLHTKEHLILH